MTTAVENAKAAVAKRTTAPAGQPTGIAELLRRQMPEIERAVSGTALDPQRFARVALTVIRQSRQLQRCRPESLLGALMTCAQLGLEPGPLGEAYLVPYGDQCTFIAGYQGMIKLAWNSGQLRHIDADVVHANDRFLYRKGADPTLEHEPALGERGDVRCYYAVASFLSGGHVAVVLSKQDVNRYRARSASAKSGRESPWDTDYDAMALKTCVRRLAKFLPMATAMQRAAQADETVRTLGGGEDVLDVTDWAETPAEPEPAASSEPPKQEAPAKTRRKPAEAPKAPDDDAAMFDALEAARDAEPTQPEGDS